MIRLEISAPLYWELTTITFILSILSDRWNYCHHHCQFNLGFINHYIRLGKSLESVHSWRGGTSPSGIRWDPFWVGPKVWTEYRFWPRRIKLTHPRGKINISIFSTLVWTQGRTQQYGIVKVNKSENDFSKPFILIKWRWHTIYYFWLNLFNRIKVNNVNIWIQLLKMINWLYY